MNRLLNRKALAILCAIWVLVMVLPLQPVIFSMDLNWVSGVVILLSLMAFLNLLYWMIRAAFPPGSGTSWKHGPAVK